MKRLWVFLLTFALSPASREGRLVEVRNRDFYPVVDASVDSPNTIVVSPTTGTFEVYNGDGQSFLKQSGTSPRNNAGSGMLAFMAWGGGGNV